MGKTYRRHPSYEEDPAGSRRGKHHAHSNNRRTGGMRIINDYDFFEQEDNDLDEQVNVEDGIIINKK